MIHLRGVTKSFDSKVILDGIDLSIESQETHVIVGQSGQGKSVTLKLICALMAPGSGEVEIDGKVISIRDRDSVKHVRERVNMVFQFGALFDSLSVRDNIAFTLTEREHLPRREVDKRVAECLEMVNLPGIENHMPADLSGGMKKRVGFARAMITHPKIMLYDEPTSGLDPVTSDLINDLIIEARRRLGMTSVVVTHDMASAYKVGDRISMLAKGQLIATGTPDEIRSSNEPRVRQFVEGRAEGPLTTEKREEN